MQLIDTEIDIGVVNSKMSTMQQESLEKFSLVENVCSAITNGNDECTNKEVIDVCKENFEKNEQTIQCSVSKQGALLIREKNVEITSEVTEKESEQNESYDKLENVKDKQIRETSVALVSEKLETEVNNVAEDTISDNKKQNEIEEKSGESTKQDILCNNESENKIEARSKDNITEYNMDQLDAKNDAIDTLTKLENSLTEDKSKDNKETEHKIDNCDVEDVEMDVNFDKKEVNKCLSEDKTENKIKDNHTSDNKTPLEENASQSLSGGKTEDEIGDNGTSDDNDLQENEEDVEMSLVFEEENIVNDDLSANKTKDMVEENKDIEMEVAFEEDNVNDSLTEVSTKCVVEEDKHIEMELTFEEKDKVNNSSILDKCEEVVKQDEDIEMDPTFKDENRGNDNSIQIQNKSEDEVKESIKVNDRSEKQNQKDVQTHTTAEIKDNHEYLHSQKNESNKNTLKDSTPGAKQDKIEEQTKHENMDHSSKEEKRETMHSAINETTFDEGPEKRNTNEIQIQQTDEIDFNNENHTVCQDIVNVSATMDKNEDETKNDAKMDHLLDENVVEQNLKGNENIISKRDKTEEQIKQNNDIENECTVQTELKEKGDTDNEKDKNITETTREQADKEGKTEDVMKIQHKDNFSSDEKTHDQDKRENLLEGNVTETCTKDKITENENSQNIGSKVNNTTQDTEICNDIQQDRVNITNENQENTTNSSSNDKTNNNTELDKIQEIQNLADKLEKQNVDQEHNTLSSKSRTTEIANEEVINITDEKDDEIDTSEKEQKNDSVEEMNTSEKLTTDTPANKPSVEDTNTQEENNRTELSKKKTFTHISKLSNTLDILSDDDEEDQQQNEKEIQNDAGLDEKQCTSINIDDDDDIMVIDEESNSTDDKSNANSLPEPDDEISSEKERNVDSKDKDTKCLEVPENKKDTVQKEMITTNVDETKTTETKHDVTAQVDNSEPKKPLMQVNFLKTCAKNIAVMTRDELEEFCIVKIVESVVERSNLSELKAQIKALSQSVEEYKTKASILAKQNRDIQLVLKSVQEEQKKKNPNTPITPLKITRSVGMQVLTEPGGRKRVNNSNAGQASAASNGGRQGKAGQNASKLLKITNTNSPATIPVPRLIPAVNNNSNNGKAQSPNANTSAKQNMPVSVTSSPIQNMSNGLPVTPLAQKPEKRSHNRMQQNNNAFTVDLTDDEPPAKVISRNVTPPVRLVPPQNLLAPNRQPFGSGVSNPRKVYIPISGSQTPVGVRPGQTIMLKAITPQGPRQRLPTPGVVKHPNTIRMQRMPASRHPAPLPDSVKQYQPVNWKALPPAPELKLSKVDNGIVISWKIDGYLEENYEEIASYQLYAYQETSSPPSTTLWKKIGDVKALPLPMACTLTQFMAGFKYYFAVRAVDIRSRLGPFSLPGSILLLNKM